MKKTLIAMLAVSLFFSAKPVLAVDGNHFALKGDLVMEVTDYVEHPASKREVEKKLASLVYGASKGQARMVDFFAGPNGLTGVIIQGPEETSKRAIAWVPAGGNMLFVGKVFAKDGEDLTQKAHDAFFSSTSGSMVQMPREDAYGMAQEFKGLYQFGIRKPVNTLYVFFSPGCTYCKRLYRNVTEMKKAFTDARIEVKWLPVAFDDQSLDIAAGILKEGMDAWGRPGLVATKENISAVQDNSRLLAHTVTEVMTPTLMWKAVGKVDLMMYAPDKKEMEGLIGLLSDK